MRTLTENWRVHGGQAHKHTQGNKIKIFLRTRPCVCSCACPSWPLQLSIRVLTFLSLILCYSYFGTFLFYMVYLFIYLLIKFCLNFFPIYLLKLAVLKICNSVLWKAAKFPQRNLKYCLLLINKVLFIMCWTF